MRLPCWERLTLRPYWIGRAEQIPAGWGLPIDLLMKQRNALSGVPSRRRAQLRSLFDRVACLGADRATKHWRRHVTRLLERVERDWAQTEPHPVRSSLEALGGLEIESWSSLMKQRSLEPEEQFGHGLVDLLCGWDWLFAVDADPVEYEGGRGTAALAGAAVRWGRRVDGGRAGSGGPRTTPPAACMTPHTPTVSKRCSAVLASLSESSGWRSVPLRHPHGVTPARRFVPRLNLC